MKTIKSVLSLVAAVFIGSSAWAKDPSEPIVETNEVGFAREQFFDPVLALRPRNTETPASPNAQWEVWSNDPDLVTVAVTEPGVEVKREDAKDQDTYVGQSAQATMWASLENSGTTWVYLQNNTDHKCYAFKVVCDVVNCVSVALKRSKTPEDKSGESWYEIDPDWIKPSDIASDGYAFSSDEGVAEIKEENGKFYLHAGGKDGQTRVVFATSRSVMLDTARKDKKIWMFYVTSSTVEVEKFLSFPEGFDTNKVAMLNIRSHYLEGVADITNRVLFVGTGCAAHYADLKNSIVRSLNTISDKAEVEAYILTNGQEADDPQSVHTIFPKGYPVTANSLVRYGNDGRGLHPGASGTSEWNPLTSSGHACLKEFYRLLYSIANDPETRYKYDYIVLEFDGTRLASPKGTWNINREQSLVVSEWLNEYYEGRKDSPGSRIIWIVDDDKTARGSAPQSIHDQERTRGEGGKDAYFRPFSAYNSDGSSAFEEIEDMDAFRGLLGLLNPWLCLENKLFDLSGTDLTDKLDEVLGAKVSFRSWSSTHDCYVGQTYAYTAFYDDPDNLVKFLAERIVPTSYAAMITDNVETQGLEIEDGPYIYGSYSKAAAEGYEPDPTGKDSGIWTELGDLPTAGMSASGTVWKAGNSITGITENITREFWNLVQLKIEDKDGSFRAGAKYDAAKDKLVRDPNLNTNALDVAQGEAAIAHFYDVNRPDLAIDDEATTTWDWEMEKIPLAIEAAGVSRVYNGTGTNATVVSVKSGDTDVTDATITAIYSTDEGATWSEPEAFAQEKFVNVTNLQVKLIAFENDHYLTATSDFVTVEITPRPVMLEAKSAAKIYEEGNPLTESGFTVVPKDDEDVQDYLPDYGFVGNEGVESVSMTAASKQVDAGECANKIEEGSEVAKAGTILSNYEFLYRDGKLGVVSALPYEAIYDGQGHSIAMQFGNISGSPTIEYSWDGEGGWSDSDSNKVHVTSGTALYYKVDLGYAQTGVGSSTITITQRLVTVVAVNTNKVYSWDGTNLTPDPTFTWKLKEGKEYTDILAGEEEDVKSALEASGTLQRVAEDPAVAAAKGFGPETDKEDVLDERAPGYWHYGVITTNDPFEVEIKGFKDYRVAFIPGNFAIYPTNCAFAAESGTFDYVGIYDGEPHTIDLIVIPGTDHKGDPTTVSFSTDNKTWTDPIAYDKDWRSVMPTYTHVTNKAPVYVKAENLPNFYETNMVAYVTITQRIVYVTADYAEKVYDGEPLTKNTFTVTAATKDTGFVGSESFANLETQMTEGSTITDAGTKDNEISATATYSWADGTLASDYIVKTKKNTLKITKRPIVPGKPGDNPEEGKSLAWITSAVKVYDGVATGVVAGVKGIATKDLGSVTFDYSETDPAAKKALLTASAPSGEKTDTDWSQKYTNVKGNDEVRTVWCTVSAGDNYTPCTVKGTVKITKRPVTLTAPTKSCAFDAIPAGGLTFTEDEITISETKEGEGMVDGERFKFTIDSKSVLTAPGKADAKFTIGDGDDGKTLVSNYNAKIVPGKLSVDKKPADPCADPVCVTAFRMKFSGKTASQYKTKKEEYKTVQKISGSGYIFLQDDSAYEAFTKIKLGKTAIAPFMADADVEKLTYFGKKLETVTSSIFKKPGSKYALESDIALAVEGEDVSISQVGFGKVTIVVSKGSKSPCGEPTESCVNTLVPGSYSGWFTGSFAPECLDEEAYEDCCNEFDVGDGAIFGGTWSAKYNASDSNYFGRHPLSL